MYHAGTSRSALRLHHRNVCGAGGKGCRPDALGGQKTEEISVLTPKGLWVTTAVEEIQSGDGWVSCGVRKDAGDDIDVTAQSLICVKAKKTAGTKIVIDGGVRRRQVTKPGWNSRLAQRRSILSRGG